MQHCTFDLVEMASLYVTYSPHFISLKSVVGHNLGPSLVIIPFLCLIFPQHFSLADSVLLTLTLYIMECFI